MGICVVAESALKIFWRRRAHGAGSGAAGWTPSAMVAAILALIVLALFVIVEGWRGDSAMMPLALFASRNFIGLTQLTLLLYGALGALFVLIAYVLIEAAGYRAFAETVQGARKALPSSEGTSRRGVQSRYVGRQSAKKDTLSVQRRRSLDAIGFVWRLK
jgi:hypothetical protein